MDAEHFHKTVGTGEWSYRYDVKYVKQTIKPKIKKTAGPEVLSGTEVKSPSFSPRPGDAKGLAQAEQLGHPSCTQCTQFS